MQLDDFNKKAFELIRNIPTTNATPPPKPKSEVPFTFEPFTGRLNYECK